MAYKLNPAQHEAVHTLKGPLLVLAGAGSGKTRVVTIRIGKLIESGIAADRILAVTFTNKAALEMQHRIAAELGLNRKGAKRKKTPRPQIGTFHSTCVRVLKRHATKLGYPAQFTIYDRSDQESIARQVLRDLRVSGETMKPGDLLNQLSSWKNGAIRPDQAGEIARTDKEHLAASGYRRYQQALKLCGAFDFDDLLLATEQLLSDFPEVSREEANRFDHVLVDEYQDTNGSQYRIIKQLSIGHRNLCVVGDDDQSIYGWRGAEVQHILNFKKDWPDAKVVRLEENYRSTGAILAMANRLIVFNKHRHDKMLIPARGAGQQPRILQFKTEVEEAQGVAAEIARRLEDRQWEPKDFAILFRTNEQPRVFETELRKAKLPYVLMGSQSFFDRKEVRDIMAFMRMVDSPRDEVSLLRIINVPPRGLGAKSVEQLLDRAVRDGKSVWESMELKELVDKLPEAARKGILQLKGIAARFSEMATKTTLVETVRELITTLGYEAEIRRLYPDPEEQQNRLAAIEEVINAVAEYEEEADEPSMAGFLSEVALAGREFGNSGDKEKARNAISLMTLHSAKGLEFPFVYMVGMEEGLLPHRRSIGEADEQIDEERRLCYVGITRAQDELTLSVALQRMKWGKLRPTFPSRFLYEVTGQADNPNCLKSIRGAKEEIRRGARSGKPPREKKGST
jgi:DNA helicase II / ATP-dependent DNA helicase PcrA